MKFNHVFRFLMTILVVTIAWTSTLVVDAQAAITHVPFRAGTTHQLTQGLHEGNAYDFGFGNFATGGYDLDIVSAAPGVVVALIQDRTAPVYGIYDNTCYITHNNYIEVLHDDGSRARYSHIAANSARFAVGDHVNYGDVIASQGNVGCTNGQTHLHYQYWNPSGQPTEPVFIEQPYQHDFNDGVGIRTLYDSQNQPSITGTAPAFTSSDHVYVVAGQNLNHVVTYSGDPTPTLVFESENLPNGVTRANETVSGIPTQVGDFQLVIRATNGITPDALQTLTITVTGDAPVITSAASVNAMEQSFFNHPFTASGNPAPTLSYTNANLPPGVTLSGDTLAGRLESGGTYSITVTAHNGVQPDAVQEFTIVVGFLPEPPATPLCEDHNFSESGIVRASTADAFGYSINCRVLYQNGSPTQWLGGNLYSEANLGVPGLADLGIEQAVDIFSPSGITYFQGGGVFCLRGEGTLIWLASSGMPRHPEIIGSYVVPEFSGFTCATLFEPGTLILVRQNPVNP